jgi:hypothetical protein
MRGVFVVVCAVVFDKVQVLFLYVGREFVVYVCGGVGCRKCFFGYVCMRGVSVARKGVGGWVLCVFVCI